MKKVILSVLFFFTLLISVIIHIPAHIALNYLPPIPGIKYSGISGSVWNGQAASLHWQDLSLGSLSWNFNFISIFMGKIDVSVDLKGVAGLSGDGHIGYSFNGVYVDNLRFFTPASIVKNFISMPFPVDLSGKFKLSVQNYQANKPLCNLLNGNLIWDNAQIVTPIGTIDPGPASATFSCKAGNVVAKSRSKSEAIETEFDVSLSPNASYILNGYLKPGPTLSPDLKNQLKWLGSPDAKGRYQIDFSG